MNARPDDGEVAATTSFWKGLGLPGLVDAHVHFLPPRLEARVWQYFDEAGPLIGRAWPIRYRLTTEERIGLLARMGVRAYPALAYAHRPGMVDGLSDWTMDLARTTPACVPSATFYPEEGALTSVRRLLDRGARVFKVHVQVGRFDPRDPLLDDVWGVLSEAGAAVVIHAGSGPVATEHTGPGPIADVLARHPRLTAVIAHLGAPEYEAFLDLAEGYPNVHLDTTMVFTSFFDELAPFPAELLPRLVDLQDRIVLGTDLPTIPYPYAHQLESLARLDLGDDWLRAVCWTNGARLLGVS
ncbi:MAG: amidohydrolase family protein [Actinomycetales bacterium]